MTKNLHTAIPEHSLEVWCLGNVMYSASDGWALKPNKEILLGIPMEPEIIQFANSIGANELTEADEIYGLIPSLSHERNYFKHSSGFLVIKISRSQKPFWGLTKRIMDVLNSHSYHLILLKSASQGWVFSKEEAMSNIERRDWNLDSKGLQYKINMPLPDDNIFFGPRGCLRKVSGK